MHHTHVHEDLLLWYILFERETHEHEGVMPVSISFALMHMHMFMHSHTLMIYHHMIAYM